MTNTDQICGQKDVRLKRSSIKKNIVPRNRKERQRAYEWKFISKNRTLRIGAQNDEDIRKKTEIKNYSRGVIFLICFSNFLFILTCKWVYYTPFAGQNQLFMSIHLYFHQMWGRKRKSGKTQKKQNK